MADCNAADAMQKQQQQAVDAPPAPIPDMATAPPDYTACVCTCSNHSNPDCDATVKGQKQQANAAPNSSPDHTTCTHSDHDTA